MIKNDQDFPLRRIDPPQKGEGYPNIFACTVFFAFSTRITVNLTVNREVREFCNVATTRVIMLSFFHVPIYCYHSGAHVSMKSGHQLGAN